MPKSDGKRSKKGKGTDKMWNLKIWDDDSQDINPSLWADITVSPIKFKKIKISKDEFQDSYSGVGQSGSQDLFPSEDIFPSTASLEADIKPSPKKFKKLNLWNDDSQDILDESQDSYSGGPSGSQIFPTQVVLESQDITEDGSDNEEPVVTENDPYAYSNFNELHQVMVNVFKRIWKKPLETHSDASRKFLKFCDAVVRIRNDELQEMIENGEIFQRNEDSSPNE